MINKLLFIFLMIFSFSCSQKTKDFNLENDKKMENKTFYFIDYDYNKKCGFEIYINDILVKRYLKPVNIDNAITPLNSYIINSGRQNIKVVLYPLKNNDEIELDADFNLKIFYIDNYNNEVLTSPNQGKIIFDLSKIAIDKKDPKSWIYNGYFDISNIPYNVIGWSKSKNLKDIPGIDGQVREKFSLLQKALNNKDAGQFIKLLSKSIDESKKFYYLTDKQQENSVKGIEELLSQPNIRCAALDNTIIKFYANGRLATLETVDGEPALRVIEERDGYKSEDSFPIMLFMPENSNELEVIR